MNFIWLIIWSRISVSLTPLFSRTEENSSAILCTVVVVPDASWLTCSFEDTDCFCSCPFSFSDIASFFDESEPVVIFFAITCSSGDASFILLSAASSFTSLFSSCVWIFLSAFSSIETLCNISFKSSGVTDKSAASCCDVCETKSIISFIAFDNISSVTSCIESCVPVISITSCIIFSGINKSTIVSPRFSIECWISSSETPNVFFILSYTSLAALSTFSATLLSVFVFCVLLVSLALALSADDTFSATSFLSDDEVFVLIEFCDNVSVEEFFFPALPPTDFAIISPNFWPFTLWFLPDETTGTSTASATSTVLIAVGIPQSQNVSPKYLSSAL